MAFHYHCWPILKALEIDFEKRHRYQRKCASFVSRPGFVRLNKIRDVFQGRFTGAKPVQRFLMQVASCNRFLFSAIKREL